MKDKIKLLDECIDQMIQSLNANDFVGFERGYIKAIDLAKGPFLMPIMDGFQFLNTTPSGLAEKLKSKGGSGLRDTMLGATVTAKKKLENLKSE